MKLHRYTLGVLVAALLAVALPLFAQDMSNDTSSTSSVTSTTTTVTTTDQARFDQPVATPTGQGWYAAASTTSQDAFMSQSSPWSNDLIRVRGVGRVAVVDGDTSPRGVNAAAGMVTPAGANRLITGVAQWVVPTDNSAWEVRFTGIDPGMPFHGVGVMREEHGDTGISTPNFPRALSYIALYGPVTILRNGQQLASGLPGQIMVTQGLRLPDTGRLLDTPNVRPEDIQFHVLVNAPIPGTDMKSLYVFWPYSTLDLRNLSNPVALLPSELQVAQSLFVPNAAVAGYRSEVTTIAPAANLLLVSLRDRFLARSDDVLPMGNVTIQVTNDSTLPQGFHIQGPCIDQSTAVLNPGEQATMSVNLQPGTYRVASFFPSGLKYREGRRRVITSTGAFTHWDTFSVQNAPAVVAP